MVVAVDVVLVAVNARSFARSGSPITRRDVVATSNTDYVRAHAHDMSLRRLLGGAATLLPRACGTMHRQHQQLNSPTNEATAEAEKARRERVREQLSYKYCMIIQPF